VSVLWKADVYRTEAERARRSADQLSVQDVADVFNEDLERRDAGMRFHLGQLDDPSLRAVLAKVYPEARPVGALPSSFESYS